MGAVDILRKLLTVRNVRGEATSAHFRMAARAAARRMISRDDGPVLDVAGREGLLFDPRVSPLAECATVLDLESPPLREARRCYGGRGTFVCGDLTRLPFRDGAFGAAVCVGTFYNLPESGMVRDGLREMARVVRPGGRVICEFRNAANPFMYIASRYARRYDPSLGDLPLHPFTREALRELFSGTGLTSRGYGPFFRP
jgi:ubiquinone/menaquinone biosynthesis C-methylase UbiE